MPHSIVRTATLALVAILAVACGGAATPAPSATPSAPPVTFDDFSTAFCGSFTALIRAVGNPDAGTPSVLSKALDDAIAAGDALAADRAATAMLAQLETGRQQAGIAARWQPAAPTMAQMDRLLAAFEAMTTAKRAAASHTPGAVDPQQAFESAGGVQAWSAVLEGVGSMKVPVGAAAKPCPAMQGKA